MITGNLRSWHDPQWNVNRQPVLWDDQQCNESNFGGWQINNVMRTGKLLEWKKTRKKN